MFIKFIDREICLVHFIFQTIKNKEGRSLSHFRLVRVLPLQKQDTNKDVTEPNYRKHNIEYLKLEHFILIEMTENTSTTAFNS